MILSGPSHWQRIRFKQMGSRSQSRGSAETWPCPRVLSLDKTLRFTSSLSLSLSNLEKFGQSAWSLISARRKITLESRENACLSSGQLPFAEIPPTINYWLFTVHWRHAVDVTLHWLHLHPVHGGVRGGKVASSKTNTCFMLWKLR